MPPLVQKEGKSISSLFASICLQKLIDIKISDYWELNWADGRQNRNSLLFLILKNQDFFIYS